MKKLYSAILLAALLALSAVCALAGGEEEPIAEGADGKTAVVYNFLAALTDTDTEAYTVKRNADGSVTVTLKADATEDTPILLATYTDAKIDLSKPSFFAADFKAATGETDFRLHYTRTDKTADLYFTGAKKANDYTKHETDSSIVWDLSAYISGDKRFENNIHEFLDLALTVGSTGDSITFNTLAIVNDADAMRVGIPLVAPATEESSDSSTETSAESSAASSEENSADASSEESSDVTSSDAPSSVTSSTPDTTSATSSTGPASGSTSSQVPTGDTGVILYVVLALLGTIGAIAVVRVRQ